MKNGKVDVKKLDKHFGFLGRTIEVYENSFINKYDIFITNSVQMSCFFPFRVEDGCLKPLGKCYTLAEARDRCGHTINHPEKLTAPKDSYPQFTGTSRTSNNSRNKR